VTAPTRPRLRAKYERRKRDVVTAAARLFAERGYRQASIDDLVEATGLQRGGLYHYIDGKQQLLLLIHDELMTPLLERAEAIVAGDAPPTEQLRELVRAWVEHVASHRDHMTVFAEERRLIESDPSWTEVRAARRSFSDLLAGVIARGVANGELAAEDEDVVLMSILGVVNHTAQWYDPSGRLAPADLADRYVDLLVEGLRPR
jgi:AcrR family transcriptional regulator